MKISMLSLASPAGPFLATLFQLEESDTAFYLKSLHYIRLEQATQTK